MAMKEYSAFPKAPGLLEPHHQIALCHIHDSLKGGNYSSAEMQLVYSTVSADWDETVCISHTTDKFLKDIKLIILSLATDKQ